MRTGLAVRVAARCAGAVGIAKKCEGGSDLVGPEELRSRMTYRDFVLNEACWNYQFSLR